MTNSTENVHDGNLGPDLHMTYTPSITEWIHGDVRERIVIPDGETTDYSSIPITGFLGWLAKRIGFDKNAPYFTRSGKIHDMLYWAIKYRQGILPLGWYQYFNPDKQTWDNAIAYVWTRPQADAIWARVSIDDGCPPHLAYIGQKALDWFGGIHMFFSN